MHKSTSRSTDASLKEPWDTIFDSPDFARGWRRWSDFEWPLVEAWYPGHNDPEVVEAAHTLVSTIAEGLAGSRGGSLSIDIRFTERGLGARVRALPALARRERRAVLAMARKLNTTTLVSSILGIPHVAEQVETDPIGVPVCEPVAEESPTPLSTRFNTFDLNLVLANLTALQYAPSESDQQQRRSLKRLAERVEWHRSTPPLDWRKQIAELRENYPNFSSVIDLVVLPHLALLSAGAVRSRMVPILLVGPPGVGKTHFARQLAKLLNTSSLVVDLSSATTNGSLVGVSTFWANTSPGLLLGLLGWGHAGQEPFADPVVVLDEIDKVTAERYDPIGPLHALLEAESACQFEDQSLPGTHFDASLVRWILTANDVEGVPAPIRSRTVTCHISAPSHQEMKSVVSRIMSQIVKKLGIWFDSTLPEALLEAAASGSPREVSTRLEVAIGHAVAAGRRHLATGDWRIDSSRPASTPMGFLRP